MNFEPVITAAAGIFPGQHGPQPLDDFWRDVRHARPARLSSLERRWGLSREQYFSPKPGTEYRTYLDVAYTISPDSGCESDIGLGAAVVRDLLSQGTVADKRRMGLCLATLWTEQTYFRADSEYILTGTRPANLSLEAGDVQAGALAATLGLGGPALAIDTACASSLYAIDAALALIDSGAADSVVVLGLNTHIPPFLYLGFSKLTALSPRGRILPFSQDASGIIISEAVAAVLVEPRDRAERAGRPPIASIRGLGLSADGGEQSVFAPGPEGQHNAYQRAYKSFDPGQIGYVEAHGTATVLGDNTEIASLDRFFRDHVRGRKLPIGSAKALIGHSLGTAGLVSVVKALRMITDGVIPPHIPVEENTKLERSCLRLPAAAEPWAANLHVRAVGISSFGFGGANAHLVLSQPSAASHPPIPRPSVWRPIAISDAAGIFGEADGSQTLFGGQRNEPKSFPTERFWQIPTAEYFPCGHFFPAELEFEADGLRMGPNGLRRLDPFQRLCMDQARKVLTNCADPRQEVGIVYCSNLGGETGLQISRHYAAQLSGRFNPNERYANCKPTLEAIASSLPSLASGFAAYHLGIRGFHQTVSGDSGAFWRVLNLSGYWLQNRCSALVIVAGRHLKSPLDFGAGMEQPGEAAAALLLRPVDADANPVAVITSFIPIEEAQSFSRPPFMEVCQLDAAAPVSQRGSAQRATGFLQEATGIESIFRVLSIPGTGPRGIELRRGADIAGYVLIDKRREWEVRSAPLRMPVAASFQPAPVVTQAPAIPFLEWQRETELAVRSFIRAQALTAALLSTPANRQLHQIRRAPQNTVITPPEIGPSGALTAGLRIDENHPYFFDHPLDHVPGILLLEAILQLSETKLNDGEYLQSIDLKFRKFCEKDQPAQLVAQTIGAHQMNVELQQAGVTLAVCTVARAFQPEPIALPAYNSAPPPEPFSDPRMLHKREAANVLVSSYRAIPGRDAFACDILPPEPGHILSEGADDCFSLLYILETARQFVMLLAHVHEGIPLDQPMNLIRIHLWLDRPVPRGARLSFECARQPVRRIGGMVLADLELTLKSGSCNLGGAKIKSQVVDKETYQQQRGPAGVQK